MSEVAISTVTVTVILASKPARALHTVLLTVTEAEALAHMALVCPHLQDSTTLQDLARVIPAVAQI